MALSSWTFFIQTVSAIFASGVKEPESRCKVWQYVNSCCHSRIQPYFLQLILLIKTTAKPNEVDDT